MHGMFSACEGWQEAYAEGDVMTQSHMPAAVHAQLIKVGLEVFPVYGDESSGWSVDPVDLAPGRPHAYRYQSLDELFFALVNLNLSPEGQA
jgi:hypothetical protein